MADELGTAGLSARNKAGWEKRETVVAAHTPCPGGGCTTCGAKVRCRGLCDSCYQKKLYQQKKK